MRVKQVISIGLIFLAGCFMMIACGKKGAPLPPIKDGNILAVPDNLAFSMEGDRVTLTWTHAIDPVDAKLSPEAFEVFMATKTKDGCEGCPFVFESKGLVPLPDMVYRQTLQPELHYYFRIQAIGKDETKSTYSKTLYINLEQ